LQVQKDEVMKINKATMFPLFAVPLLLMSLFIAPAFASEDGSRIRDSIIKAGSGMKDIQVYTIRDSGGWALATITYDDDNRNVRGGSALLRKSGANWEFMQFSGKTPTTDLLKQNKVPSNHWGNLIGGASFSATKPILDFLHSKYPRQSFESIEMSDVYALATWYGGEDSGMTLLKEAGTSWKVILSTGGVIDAETMRKNSVPERSILRLTGIQ
jgi:hypothetical protein